MVKSITLHTLEKEARKIVELTKASESPNADKKLAAQIEKFEDALFSISYQHRLLFLNAAKATIKKIRFDKALRGKLLKAVETEDKLLVKVAAAKTPDLKVFGEKGRVKTPDLKAFGEKERVESKILKLLEPKISLLNEESEKVANLLYEICEKAYYLSLVSFI